MSLKKFLQELLGTIDLPSLMRLMLIALIVYFLGNTNNVYSKPKDHPQTLLSVIDLYTFLLSSGFQMIGLAFETNCLSVNKWINIHEIVFRTFEKNNLNKKKINYNKKRYDTIFLATLY
jgi:hypothetical protein